MINISTYASIIFDCDGVILDSNQIKTNAFYKATLPWGYKAAKAFVEYHKSNGGVSRYVKFKYFLDEIAPEYSNKTNASSFETMIRVYENEVQEGLLNCNIAIGLFELRKMTSNAKWFCVSGSDQQESRSSSRTASGSPMTSAIAPRAPGSWALETGAAVTRGRWRRPSPTEPPRLPIFACLSPHGAACRWSRSARSPTPAECPLSWTRPPFFPQGRTCVSLSGRAPIWSYTAAGRVYAAHRGRVYSAGAPTSSRPQRPTRAPTSSSAAA